MTSDCRFLRLVLFVVCLGIYSPCQAQQPAANLQPITSTPSSTSTTAAPAGSESSIDLQREAELLVVKGDMQGAMDKVNAAIKLNPQSVSAYVLRGSIYSQKKDYDSAERDFQTAHQIDPANSVVNFNLAEMKFVRKQYDAAREGFAALQKDKGGEVADLATFKVFLCDLYGNHAEAAAQELDAFNKVGSKPSYYFANLAWSLFNHKTEEGRGWLNSALYIYPAQKNELYASSLRELGYLPLPPPPAK